MAGKWSTWFTGLLGRGKASLSEKEEQEPLHKKDPLQEIPSHEIEFEDVLITADEERQRAARPAATPSPASGGGEWEPGDVVLKDYRVEGELGEGGMGKVYLVSSLSTRERFAVKRVKSGRDGGDAARRNFVSELQTWIDLPVHPHLAACRFFRSVGDEIVIFAEYLEGGSLDRWILGGEGSLYEGEPDTVLARILDIAIQSAWGLHALHQWGLTHQDMKPGNVLLTADGQSAKVSDFGLARARTAIPGLSDSESGTSYAAHGRFMTKEFCSPEQKEGRPLSRKTDVWSWGLSVLQMFTGTVWWKSGNEAEAVLQSILRWGGRDSRIPAMPPEVGEILGKCFEKDPVLRWASLFEAAVALRNLFSERMGGDLCPVPAFPRKTQGNEFDLERRTVGGKFWEDPRVLLSEAFEAAGLDAAEVLGKLPPREGSRQAQAIADLAAYEEVVATLLRRIRSGVKALEPQLAAVYLYKAFVHQFLDDVPGALNCYDRAIEVYERLVNVEGRGELANQLAGAYQNKAVALHSLGDLQGAVSLCDRAIEVYERLVNVEGRGELANDLALAYQNKAAALDSLGDLKGAVSLYDRAIEVYERLVNVEGRWELANYLALAYQNKAVALRSLGDLQGAVSLCDRAIEVYERLVNVEGRGELANDLALAYQNKAIALRSLGDLQGAVSLYDRAIEVYERLVHVEGRGELANQLAGAYQNKANALRSLGELQGAVSLCDRAIEVYERLVNVEGRWEFAKYLAGTYQNKGVALRSLGDLQGALSLYDRAIEIYERLVNVEGRGEFANDLARTYMNKANALVSLGDLKAAVSLSAVSLCDRAIEIYEQLVKAEGKWEFANVLAATYEIKAGALYSLGEFRQALGLFDQTIQIREQLVKAEGKWEFAKDLARTYENKGLTLKTLGEFTEALGLYAQAIAIEERLVEE